MPEICHGEWLNASWNFEWNIYWKTQIFAVLDTLAILTAVLFQNEHINILLKLQNLQQPDKYCSNGGGELEQSKGANSAEPKRVCKSLFFGHEATPFPRSSAPPFPVFPSFPFLPFSRLKKNSHSEGGKLRLSFHKDHCDSDVAPVLHCCSVRSAVLSCFPRCLAPDCAGHYSRLCLEVSSQFQDLALCSWPVCRKCNVQIGNRGRLIWVLGLCLFCWCCPFSLT